MSKIILKRCLISCVLFFLYITSSAQSCANHKFPSNQIFNSCNDLPHLNSSLHWNYDLSSNTVKIAYRHTGDLSSRWVAWALNPTGQGMVGAQALVAFQKSDGSMRAYTSPITGYQTQLQEGDLSFPVFDLIFATLKLDNVSSTLNQVWQDGPVSGDVPAMHQMRGSNVQSMGTLNLLSGVTETTKGALNSNTKKKNIHGLLNAISWGILLPVGAVFARYLKVFPSADPAWFYLHATCQTSAYVIGVAGVATGIRLGNKSPGIQYTAHRIIGIVIFCLATLQVTALFLRPKKDHKYRFYWNVYHHVIGYSVIVLSIVNIFKGFDILNPEEMWKRMYVGILIGLAFVVAILEVYTWIVVVKRNKSESSTNEKMSNGTNGYDAYAARREDIV